MWFLAGFQATPAADCSADYGVCSVRSGFLSHYETIENQNKVPLLQRQLPDQVSRLLRGHPRDTGPGLLDDQQDFHPWLLLPMSTGGGGEDLLSRVLGTRLYGVSPACRPAVQ